MSKFRNLIYLHIFIIFSLNIVYAQTLGKRFIQPVTSTKTSPQQIPQTVEPFEEYFALEEVINPTKYIIGPGDVFGLNILTSENVTLSLTVSPTGDLLIPSVGVVNINGKTLIGAITYVKDFVKSQAYPNAIVDMTLLNIRQFQIQISGVVNKPGFYVITPLTRLHEIVEQANGFHQFAQEYNIRISRVNGENTVINYLDFLRNGSLAGDPTFLEGDKIFVPFGNVEKEGIVIRGSISGRGYDIIQKGETLGEFLQRRARFSEKADLESVTITRIVNGKEKFLTIFPKDFKTTVLKPGDAIDILSERGVSVNGFVKAPGGYTFFPGYTSSDYINLAGGNTVEGDPNKSTVRHLDGTIEKGQSVLIRRGDVVVVPRTRKSVLFGDSSILEISAALTAVILTFIAATAK
ncbi:MAG: SLBB domain-containing protein [Candidatus Marinimicrobia bacterium]|nr:SLBB domain-containing protein [Candidatus Neomarinimicrobiota bacterium]